MKSRKNNVFMYFLSLVSVLFLWQILVFIKKDVSFPSAIIILKDFINILFSKEFLINLIATVKIVFIGLFFSFIAGFILGVLCNAFNVFSSLFYPVIHTLRNIPSITLYPFIILFLGVEDISRIFIIFWCVFPPIFIETITGLKSVDKSVIEASSVAGANKFQIIFRIKIPLSLTSIVTGIRIGLGNGFVAVVVAEMLGATKGLGYMVLWATNSFDYTKMYSYIFIIGIIGFISEALINKLIKKCEVRA